MVVVPHTWLEGISPTLNLSVRFVQVNSFSSRRSAQHIAYLTVLSVPFAEHVSPLAETQTTTVAKASKLDKASERPFSIVKSLLN